MTMEYGDKLRALLKISQDYTRRYPNLLVYIEPSSTTYSIQMVIKWPIKKDISGFKWGIMRYILFNREEETLIGAVEELIKSSY